MEVKRNLNTVAAFPVAPFCVETSECYHASPIDDMLLVDGIDDDDNKTVRHVNDVYLLFNQQRLAALGTDTVNKWLETLTPSNDALSELRSKCTDAQLLSIVKSKYIQSPSELQAWSGYLNAHLDSELAAIGALQAEESDEKEEEVTETSVSDTKSE